MYTFNFGLFLQGLPFNNAFRHLWSEAAPSKMVFHPQGIAEGASVSLNANILKGKKEDNNKASMCHHQKRGVNFKK